MALLKSNGIAKPILTITVYRTTCHSRRRARELRNVLHALMIPKGTSLARNSAIDGPSIGFAVRDNPRQSNVAFARERSQSCLGAGSGVEEYASDEVARDAAAAERILEREAERALWKC